VEHDPRRDRTRFTCFLHRLNSRVKQPSVAFPVDRRAGDLSAEQLGIGLVANLYHLGHRPVGVELTQGVESVVAQRLHLLIGAQLRPRRGRDLFTAVGPVVGIMEIEQRLHAGRMRTADGLQDVGIVAVFGPGRVHPDAYADDIAAVALEQFERVDRLAVQAIDGAAILHLVHIGKVAAEIEAAGRHGRWRPGLRHRRCRCEEHGDDAASARRSTP
jgi:hypothetical protein